MRCHGDRHVLPLFGPWRWAPYMRGNFHWKKYQNARSSFLSHTSKLNQQKQWDAVSKSTAKIYPSNKYNIFPSFIIDQSGNTLQLKNIVLSFHPPFEPISALFTFTGLWPKGYHYSDTNAFGESAASKNTSIVSYIDSSGIHSVWRSRTICAMLVEGIMGNIHVELF